MRQNALPPRIVDAVLARLARQPAVFDWWLRLPDETRQAVKDDLADVVQRAITGPVADASAGDVPPSAQCVLCGAPLPTPDARERGLCARCDARADAAKGPEPRYRRRRS